MINLSESIELLSMPEPNTDCWLWLGSLGKNGYGTIGIGRSKMLAHRASFLAHTGDLHDRLVLHKCDTKSCVNPAHLSLGTHRDNAIDRSLRGRRDQTTREQRKEWGLSGAKRGSWGLGLDLVSRLDRLSTIDSSGCRLWTGTVTKTTGYGEIKVDGRKTTSHRASWLAHRGEIPAGMVVMHSCDNRLCINPDHLSLGTRRDNMRDMASKSRGSFNRLTESQRRERSKRAMQTMGEMGLKLRAQARLASEPPGRRLSAVLKGWQTRRAKKAIS